MLQFTMISQSTLKTVRRELFQGKRLSDISEQSGLSEHDVHHALTLLMDYDPSNSIQKRIYESILWNNLNPTDIAKRLQMPELDIWTILSEMEQTNLKIEESSDEDSASHTSSTMNTQIRKALFVNGLSSSDVAKKFSLPLTTVEVTFRQLLDLNKADTPKHLKVYEHLIFGGLSPSQIARRMNTGEEDIRGILLDMDRETEVSDSAYESSSDSSEVDNIIHMIDSELESVSESSSEYNINPATNSIRFFLQYEKDDEDEFDLLRIQKLSGDCYDVKYSYNHASISQRDVITTMSEDKLTDYLINTFDLLAVDKKPFYSVEVQIPLYPTVKLTPDQLNEEFPTLMDAIHHSQTF